ncbi:type II toxin-antitoxin system antitoxin DNA ADP-ribosyl glycohydrolase DarG [Tannockella kyphosi]|uniref:type II toxin-antitoxin system antitoxin DNA ADP-ribosyl glycohydrolase DarG n=1 Tax=Tannockella kyphosi TaxID=2899121 RepID=UPI0020111A76|nr:macro domain-containing protein [Tannockella kyphosi]
MIKIKIGDIFNSDKEVLVNTVNCVGVMGKGIAQVYKKQFPKMFDEYKEQCDKKQIIIGENYPYYENGKVRIINFPTKQHWRSSSKLEYIVSGLDWFVENYGKLEISSIAFPPLGCGNGGLDWLTVGPIMYQKLIDLPIEIEIYAPFGTSSDQLSEQFLTKLPENPLKEGIIHEKMNENWFLVLYLVSYLSKSKYSIKVGRTIFQKICYVLSRSGTDLGLEFIKGTYGPYSPDIKKMLTILSNNNLICEIEQGNMILLSVNKNFTIDPDMFSQKDKENVNSVFQLFRRLKDTQQSELVTTILYSFDQLQLYDENVTENKLFEYIAEWKNRYDNDDYEKRIRELSRDLTSMGLMDVNYSKDYKEYDFI